MTYAPDSILKLQAYWVAHNGVPLGIVGDTAHAAVGVSYHLGRSQLAEDAYSIQLQRDKAGLSEAASAIDLGKLGGSLFNLQVFSQWLVRQCQAHAPGTSDIREIIYSPNGLLPIHRWSEPDQKVYTGIGQGDSSHLYHTHISFYRDSENRPKVGLFVPYFESTPPDSSTEDPMAAIVIDQLGSLPAGTRIVVPDGMGIFRIGTDGQPIHRSIPGNYEALLSGVDRALYPTEQLYGIAFDGGLWYVKASEVDRIDPTTTGTLTTTTAPDGRSVTVTIKGG